MLSWECLFEEIQFYSFSETSESWGRMDLIEEIIPNCGIIQNKAVTKMFFFWDLGIDGQDYRKLQEPIFLMIVSCGIYSILSRHKRSIVTEMITVKKFKISKIHLGANGVFLNRRCLCESTVYSL